MSTLMARQGDILFVQMEEESLPTTAQVVADGVIARGEATNHSHRVAPEDLALGRAKVLSEGPQTLFVEAYEQIRIVHEEHNPITLPAGRYSVVRQREYSPEMDRPVWD